MNKKKDTIQVPERLKIFSVGNSFSTDAMEYLYPMLKEAGVKDIVLGILHYRGCSVEQHLDFATNNSPVYNYKKNSSGEWVATPDSILRNAILDEKWDYITFQQSPKVSNVEESYQKILNSLLDRVEGLYADATFIWHMTWAYQQDSNHKYFPIYGNDQKKMYSMTTDCVKNYVLPNGRFEGNLIPSGTSIQNLRTSFLGDTATRDGYHLDKGIGRYTAALTWCCFFTGVSPEAITYNPCPEVINGDMMAAAKEAVANALKTPLAVTESTVKEGVDLRLTLTKEE